MSRYIDALKSYRKDNHLVHKQMAAKLGVTRAYYSKLEEGKKYPSRKLFNKINSLTSNMNPLPLECKSSHELEICSLCVQLNHEDRETFKMKMGKVIKGYNKIQPLIIIMLFELFFNSDFCSIII